MTESVTADFYTLMDQAPMTASTYLARAIIEIDSAFEKWHAEKHPELVAAFIRTCAQDFHTGVMRQGLDALRETLIEKIDSLGRGIDGLGEAIGGDVQTGDVVQILRTISKSIDNLPGERS